VEHFAELAKRALRLAGGCLILVGNRHEANLAAAFSALVNAPICNLVGRTTLPQLVAILQAADLMIGNDSGPLHIATALGKPVIAPYTCTSPIRTGPFGQGAAAIATQVACAASYLKHCRRMDCMRELTPDRLWPALEQALQQCQHSTV
jgi:ADP-heptose:LPS heptosyltransferase